MATPGQDRLFLHERRGFCKLALRERASLVPVYGFHAVDLYNTNKWFWALRNWILEKTQFAIVFPSGNGTLGLLPKRIKVSVVVGEPVPCDDLLARLRATNQLEPSDDIVSELHRRFVVCC